VLIDRAREFNLVTALARGGARLGMAGLILLGANNSLQNAIAEGDTRTLSFHHAHTGEDITITFKRNGRYDDAALKKLDWFMRDWRKQRDTKMDPHLFDLLWEVYREVGATQPIDIICGYRAPGTNAMLRARSSGVARFSQHINGKAIDFFIPGVPLAKIRAIGLRLQRGGVGFYPTSGSPFVHMDTASIRHWPSIPREQLVKIFPDGRTVHVPSDGKPLPNYALALADVERHGHAPNERSLQAARQAGVISESQVQQALSVNAAQGKRTLLARLFGFGRKHFNDDEAEPETQAPAATPKQARAPMVVASVMPKPKPIATTAIVPAPTAHPPQAAHLQTATRVPIPTARPAAPIVVAAATPNAAIPAASLPEKPKATEQPTMTTASVWSAPVKRNVWGDPVATPAVRASSPFALASIEPVATGSTDGKVLSYASESEPAPVTRARPMGRSVPRLPREATILPGTPNTTVALKPPAMSIGGQRSDSPWLRAAMLTPNVSQFLTASRLTKIDPTWLAALIEKPRHALVATFSADPSFGIVTDQFSGHAVVFLATATFTPQTTASLR
jgi:uncharacterized protein YcbK (DUF882 family)